MTKQPNVLVTGAAGFIGSHVAEHCLNQGFNVVATDDLSGGFLENLPEGVDWRLGDLRDQKFVNSLFEGMRFTYVYHLAAYAAEGLSHFVRRFNYETNLVSSINLINASVNNNVECFIFTSSIAVYGQGQVPMHEDLMPQPEDPYGISKYAVELDLRAAHEMFGLNYIIFRPHNVYGERQNISDKYRNVIGIFMNQALQGQPMTVFGNGMQTRAFSHVDDVAPIISASPLVGNAINQTFNIGADTPYSIRQLTEVVCEAIGVPLNVEYLPARNEVVDAYASHAKVMEVFAPPTPVDLQTGIQRMANWVKRHGPATPVTFSEIEIEKNLPPSWRNR